ncbi:hypothetical protein TH61_16225 [Rufibacter sp. DG15C]|uniref:hypothetical protein n=1 Tax=Rufibacter sp. DG15C TaxID=1379909 RepID=UPI00078BC34A|nr:hypothetical protein [Rufibacter sp. DG15C]AMM52423.1 hypothetical protein TH61_16225 [Rufibacter sp. DG15C]
MSLTVDCPECHEENAYFNGRYYECPDCGSEWDENLKKEPNLSNDKKEYERLIKLKEPFFTLEQGKLYECALEFPNGELEDTTIIPLAFEEGRNRQFILTDARRFINAHPQDISEIIKMDFLTLWNDGLSDYPEGFETMSAVFTTQKDGTGLDGLGIYYYEFKKTQEL